MFSTGWAYEHEDHGYLEGGTGQAMLARVPKLGTFKLQIGDPRPYIQVEDQKGQGSCAGQATSTIQEWLLGIQTKWRVKKQLSRKFSYITGQKRCGLFGKDVGCTISGVAEAAKLDGNCEESLCPYTGDNYTTDISQQAIDQALKRLVRQHILVKNYDDVLRVLGTLLAGLNIGVMITDTFMNDKTGIITPDMFKRGNIIGGHSMACLIPSERKTPEGDHYIWGVQSWGKGIHNGGWMEWHPECFELFGRSSTCEMIALTDQNDDFDDPTGGEFQGRSVNWFTDNPYAV